MSKVEMQLNGVEIMYKDFMDKIQDEIEEASDLSVGAAQMLKYSEYRDSRKGYGLSENLDNIGAAYIKLEHAYNLLLAYRDIDKMLNGSKEDDMTMEKLESLCKESN